MNHIEMYSSTTCLKRGLHRVLAVAHSLSAPVEPDVPSAWWQLAEGPDQDAARRHQLPLEGLAALYATAAARAHLDAARAALDLPPLDHGAVQAEFKAAIISHKAHQAHLGRDVYGVSNKALWDRVCADFGRAVAARFGPGLGDGPVAIEAAAPSAADLSLLRALTAFDTSPEGPDTDACVAWLTGQLEDLGFAVQTHGRALGRPLLVAHRPARGLAGHLVLYGHYDVTPMGRPERWRHPPRVLTQDGGRLYARGVADNKGPLACRLAALAGLDATPALTWLIQGEEETGSGVARALLPGVMAELAAARPTLWLDETGYHDHGDGTLRLLAHTQGQAGALEAPDAPLDQLLRGLRGLASRFGVAARHERRGLNKNVVEGGCPFNHNLPGGARYLAVGVNDSAARIHGLNESLPGWTFPLHHAQLAALCRWIDGVQEPRP